MSKVIKTYQAFKETFNELFKKYHPDNKETGDAEMFIKYHQAYEEMINNDIVKKLPEESISITITQAYQGCIVKCKNFSLVIPEKFYPSKDSRFVKDKNGTFHKIYIKIIPDKDELLTLGDKFNDINIIKYIGVSVFDIILGFEKEITVLGETIKLKVKPYEVLRKSSIILKGKGYPQRFNPKERNPLTIKFKFDKIDLNENDLSIIKEMRDKYGIN